MNRRKRLLVPILVVILLPLTLLVWLLGRQYHQERLDHALIAAIRKQDRGRVLELLDQGANANAHDIGEPPTFGQILRHWLAQVGRHSVKTDISEHPSALILACKLVPDGNSQSALHFPDEKITLALLDHGANPKASISEGYYLMVNAIMCNHKRVLRRILQSGVHPDAIPVDSKSEASALRLASAWGDAETVRMLLDHGADVNKKDEDGWSPLRVASRMGNAKTVPVLLERGAHIDAADDQRETALILAAEGDPRIQNQAEVVRILLEHGAKIDLRNVRGETALDTVKDGTDPEDRRIKALLKQHGAKE